MLISMAFKFTTEWEIQLYFLTLKRGKKQHILKAELQVDWKNMQAHSSL